MRVLIDKSLPTQISSALRNLNPESAILATGNVWIETVEEALIPVFVLNDKEFSINFSRLQSSIVEAQAMEKVALICCVVIDPQHLVRPHQMFAIQEMGSYIITLDSLDRLEKFIVFIADPKRRKLKKLMPSRDFSIFTPGEQMMLCIPNVGAVKVSRLLRHFGSIAWALSGMTQPDAVDSVLGITESDVQGFRDMIGLEDDRFLSIEMFKEDEEVTPQQPAKPVHTTKSIKSSEMIVSADEPIQIEF